MEAIITPNRVWAKPENEEALVKRVARIVCSTDEHVILQSSGYKWVTKSWTCQMINGECEK